MKRRINESQDGERIIRFCKDALNDAISLINSDDVDLHVIDEVIDTLKDRISILEDYLRQKEAKANSPLSENQKVTLTLGQLKRLVKESNDRDALNKTGAMLNDLLNLVVDNKDEELADEINDVLVKLHEIVEKTELSDKWEEAAGRIAYSFGRTSEMIALGEI